jgi:hypothetical protein
MSISSRDSGPRSLNKDNSREDIIPSSQRLNIKFARDQSRDNLSKSNDSSTNSLNNSNSESKRELPVKNVTSTRGHFLQTRFVIYYLLQVFL